MKVLFVAPHVFAGGAEKALLNLVYWLNLLGCDARIATLSVDLSKLPSRFSGVRFILPKRRLDQPVMDSVGSVLSSNLKEFFSFVSLLRKCSGEFDVVCATNFPSYWAVYFADLRKPLVWLSSEVLAPYNQTKDLYVKSPFFRFALSVAVLVDKIMVRRFDPIITCSGFNCRLVKARYGRDCLVLNTGVDYDFFNAPVTDAKTKLGLGGVSGPLLLQVGALMERKNQLLSIRALLVLKQTLSHAKLLLVGKGPWRAVLEVEVVKLGLKDDVVFLGELTEDQLRVVYGACDVNLFPVKDQTWGLVPFEAMVAGKPSVVARGCGAAEVIAKEKLALLIEPTVEALAGAVLYALKNPELMAAMVGRGQRYVFENLTWEKYARDMYDVFVSVLGSE